jgi:hypothetical protein
VVTGEEERRRRQASKQVRTEKPLYLAPAPARAMLEDVVRVFSLSIHGMISVY